MQKAYRIQWLHGYGTSDGESEVHARAWFNAEMGFDADTQERIDALAIGQRMIAAGVTDAVAIVRMPDTDAGADLFDYTVYEHYILEDQCGLRIAMNTRNAPDMHADGRAHARAYARELVGRLRGYHSARGVALDFLQHEEDEQTRFIR